MGTGAPLSAGQVVVGDNLGAHKGSGFAGWSRGEALLEVIGMAFS